jgi:uncharacterized membrane protein (DUF373 family)
MREMLSRWRLMIDWWSTQTFYQRFESIVALILTFMITLVIMVALFRLFIGVVGGLVFGALNPLEYTVFQTVFGQIMTLLIALARKFIILDLKTTPAEALFGLAAITLAVGITYWLMRERDDRISQQD